MAEQFTYTVPSFGKFSRIKLNHFHSNGTHVLRNCDFLIIVAMLHTSGPMYTCTGLPCNARDLWRAANASYLIDESHE